MKFNSLILIPLLLTALNAEVQELNYTSDAGGNLLSVVPAYPLVATTPSASISHTVEGAVVSLEVSTGGYANGVVANYYEWDFDGDGEVDATTMNPTIGYSYPTAGSHTVLLSVYDSLDEAREYTQSVTTTVDGTGEIIGLEDGGVDNSTTITYGLNGTAITNPLIIDKIKLAINGLEDVKMALDGVVEYDGDKLKQEYDGVKKLLDDSKKLMDDIKQSVDNNIANEEKQLYKNGADDIKYAMDTVKKLIDDYKKDADNSPEAIADIKDAIDGVIAMMRSGSESSVKTTSISIKQGRNTISGNIDITTLPDTIHSIWIVDGGNWYGYSPYEGVRQEIEAKYLLIEDSIVNSKGILVFAREDTQIESSDSSNDIEHSYGLGYTLHGTNGESMSASDIVCDDSNAVVMVATVRGDEPSVYVPEREIDGIENFEYLDSDDGYYILCDKE